MKKLKEIQLSDIDDSREHTFPDLSVSLTRAIFVTGSKEGSKSAGVDVLYPHDCLMKYVQRFLRERGFETAPVSNSQNVISATAVVENRKVQIQFTFTEMAKSDLTNVFIGNKLSLNEMLRDMQNIDIIRRSAWLE